MLTVTAFCSGYLRTIWCDVETSETSLDMKISNEAEWLLGTRTLATPKWRGICFMPWSNARGQNKNSEPKEVKKLLDIHQLRKFRPQAFLIHTTLRYSRCLFFCVSGRFIKHHPQQTWLTYANMDPCVFFKDSKAKKRGAHSPTSTQLTTRS